METFKAFFMALSIPARDLFAKRCGTSRAHLTNLIYCADKKANAELCIAIERESHGVVMCEHLRPDLDWYVVRRPLRKAA